MRKMRDELKSTTPCHPSSATGRPLFVRHLGAGVCWVTTLLLYIYH